MNTLVENELTTQQAAELLRISRRTLNTMIDRQIIPSRQVGIRRRVLKNDIDTYLRQHKVRRIELVR